MSAEQHDKKKFIETIRSDVSKLNTYPGLHPTVTNQVTGYIQSCMDCLYDVRRVDRGWAGMTEEYWPKKMNDDETIKVIKNIVLSNLEIASAYRTLEDADFYDDITALKKVVKTFFGISSDKQITQDTDAKVEELRAEARTLTSERSQEQKTEKKHLLLQQLARLT